MDSAPPDCQNCGAQLANRYLTILPEPYPEPAAITEVPLCPACARLIRRRSAEADNRPPRSESDGIEWIERRELISRLDRFFAAAGILEICARCHDQGTGCCPPTCRVMGSRGCDPDNRHGKTVFCAAFLCSALLNAIREVDPECARVLRWVKNELGPAEFRLYEMISRVPSAHREPERPLRLPALYPAPPLSLNTDRLRAGLSQLLGEILAVRRGGAT